MTILFILKLCAITFGISFTVMCFNFWKLYQYIKHVETPNLFFWIIHIVSGMISGASFLGLIITFIIYMVKSQMPV